MSTAFSTIYQNLAKESGFYFSGTASGTHSTTTLEDDSADGFDALDTNVITNKWMRITAADSAAPEGEARRISSVATSTATVNTAYSAAPADGDTYEIVPYHPDLLKRAIQEAVRQSYPVIYKRLTDETLVVDNLVSNWSFETFTVANTPDDWTLTNLSAGTTITEENDRVFHGTSSVKCSPSGSTGTLKQNLWNQLDMREAYNKTLHVRVRAWGSVADAAVLSVSFDGTTNAGQSKHGASNGWEVLRLDLPIDAEATQATISLATVSGATAYYDFVTAWVSSPYVTKYTLPTSFVTGPAAVLQQMNIDNPNGKYLPLTRDNRAMAGHILRIEGKGRLTVPTADSDTVEVDVTQADYLVALAAEALFRNLKNSASGGERDKFEEERAYWASQAQVRMGRPGTRKRMGGYAPRGGWVLLEDDETKTLELVR